MHFKVMLRRNKEGKMSANDVYIITLPKQAAVAIASDTKLFPVRRIFCVGRNYADHAREMGADPTRELPFFFCKPADALVADGATIPYPPQTKDLQHEVELVAAIAKGGANIAREIALDHVFGYGVGIDLTRRDLQQEAKDKKRPWDWGKGFDHSAPCSALQPASRIGHPAKGRIHLAVNGVVKQDGNLDQMIWPLPDCVAFISQSMRLEAGDLIYTGTPAGVAAVNPGDVLSAEVDGVAKLTVTIAR
jgi:fumarylpyruvate hydrolase